VSESDAAPKPRSHQFPPATTDEVVLVRRAQLGSSHAFEELVVRRAADLFRYLAVRLRDEADARDALQETLAAAWQGLPRLRDPERFWPWLVGIALRKAADMTRTREPAGLPLGRTHDQGDHLALEFREALAALSPHLRDVVVLRYALGFSEDEVAEIVGVRVGTVKSRAARARTALKEALR
jgi:RNA polymerase sigma-70 factor (ECF subfamily)